MPHGIWTADADNEASIGFVGPTNRKLVEEIGTADYCKHEETYDGAQWNVTDRVWALGEYLNPPISIPENDKVLAYIPGITSYVLYVEDQGLSGGTAYYSIGAFLKFQLITEPFDYATLSTLSNVKALDGYASSSLLSIGHSYVSSSFSGELNIDSNLETDEEHGAKLIITDGLGPLDIYGYAYYWEPGWSTNANAGPRSGDLRRARANWVQAPSAGPAYIMQLQS